MSTRVTRAPLWLALAGCAQVLDIPDDPAVVGPWRCLDEPARDPVPLANMASVQVQACNFVDNCTTAVSGLTARLCLQRDVGCTNPIVEGILDVDGLLSFNVPTLMPGFNGYLEVTSATEYCNSPVFGELGPALCGQAPGCDPQALNESCRLPIFARAMLFFNPPIFNDVTQRLQLPLIPAAAIPAMLEAAGATLDPSTGNLFITALDCDGVPAPGVTYSISEHQDRVTQLYVHNGLPNKADLETDASGVGGFLGVPGGAFVTITGFNENLEAIGEISVQTAPFTMTYSALTPLAPASL
jgi:hypothetical protein